MASRPRIAVFGAGAVGGYFGGRLAAVADVHLLARGAQLVALRSGGLRVRSVRGDFNVLLPATDDPSEVGPCDFVLFCAKSYDTTTAAEALTPLLGDETAVVSLQNGVDNEAKIAAAIGSSHVMGGVALIFAAVEAPGLVVDSGGPAALVFGDVDGQASERGQWLLETCLAAGVAAELVDDIRVRLWRKFAFICAHGGMTAAARLPIGAIRDCSESWRMFAGLVAEVVALAQAEGVALADAAVGEVCDFAAKLEPVGYSSLYYDLVAGRRLELEALHGYVVRRAQSHLLPVPLNEGIHALLAPHAAHAMRVSH